MTTLTLENARTIIAATQAARAEHGFNPMAVVVLDAGGHVLAFERQDGCSNMRFEVAYAKAHGVVQTGFGARELERRAQARPHFIAGVTSAIGGALLAVPGGVIIEDSEGTIVGAVGVTGDTSENDEVCGIAGVEAIGLIPRVE